MISLIQAILEYHMKQKNKGFLAAQEEEKKRREYGIKRYLII